MGACKEEHDALLMLKEEHDALLMLKGRNESLERAVKLEKRERAVSEEDGRKRVQQVRFSSLAYT